MLELIPGIHAGPGAFVSAGQQFASDFTVPPFACCDAAVIPRCSGGERELRFVRSGVRQTPGGNVMKVVGTASFLAFGVCLLAAPAQAFDVQPAAPSGTQAPVAAPAMPAVPAESVQLCEGAGESSFAISGVTSCVRLSDINRVTSAFGATTGVDSGWQAETKAGLQDPLPGGDEGGWSVMTGLKFDLPGQADLWLQGGYAQGAAVPGVAGDQVGAGLWTGGVLDDAMTSGFYENKQLGQVGAGLGIQASEALRLSVGASYSSAQANGMPQSDVVSVGGGFFWNPAENVDLSLSVLYSELVSGFAPVEDEVSLSARMKRGF